VLENLFVRVEGHVSSWLAERAGGRAEAMLNALLVEATILWQSQGFRRYSDDEVCCTVCFFDCCEEVVALKPSEFPVVRVVYGGAQPSQAMRMGAEHPKTVPYPDISILIGPVTIRIEAKRLALAGSLALKYVREGMRRFLDGRYSSTTGRPGVMLGYVGTDDPQAVIAAVNAKIVAEVDLAASDCLIDITSPISALSVSETVHSKSVRLLHLVFDLR
jgi:hypothetical protein